MTENPLKQAQENAAFAARFIPNIADHPSVEHSVMRAEQHGDTGVRSNKERRVGAHLSRLTKALEHEGLEKRAWDAAVESLVITSDEVPDSYWDIQRQILRDEGHGDVYLDWRIKEDVVKQLQEPQREGLNTWREYLEGVGDQYPVWFKLYAWDGMSRMSTFNKQKGQYNKRSQGTVAPYPVLNPGVLAKVYDAVTTNGANDKDTAALLAKNANFNKLYSQIMLNQKAIIPTPEKAEDVHGEWKEYTKDDIEAITKAAEGTPWCIAGPTTARRYTKDGGKFYLFHLQDPETGVLSQNAAASIRMNSYGEVAEVSGLEGGSQQIIEDALVPTVFEKVVQLPGGEKFVQAFEDKQKLIEMDKKYKNDIPFTRDEIMFLYEVDRPIQFQNGSFTKDPRLAQFKDAKASHIKFLADTDGITPQDAELMLASTEQISNYISYFLGEGFDLDKVLNRLSPQMKLTHIDKLVAAGAKIDYAELFDQLSVTTKVAGFAKLNEHGANISANHLVASLDPLNRLNFFTTLKEYGAKLTPQEAADALTPEEQLKNIEKLGQIGAKLDGEALVDAMDGRIHGPEIGLLFAHGAKLETIAEKLVTYGASKGIESVARDLVKAGIPGESIIKFLDTARFDTMYGEKVGMRQLPGIPMQVVGLLKAGVDPNIIVTSGTIGNNYINDDFDMLVEHKVDVTKLIAAIGPYNTSRRVMDLIGAGANIETIVQGISADPKYILESFKQLNDNGAGLDVDAVVAAMPPDDVLTHAAQAVELGATIDVNAYLDMPELKTVWVQKIGELLSLGADPVKIAAKISPSDVGFSLRFKSWNYDTSVYDEQFRKKYPDIYKLARERVTAEVAAGKYV